MTPMQLPPPEAGADARTQQQQGKPVKADKVADVAPLALEYEPFRRTDLPLSPQLTLSRQALQQFIVEEYTKVGGP